ncbi:MAG: alpha/beta fold hydrolase [Armatimonadetes bacterium]|nr:alpha/beta fold hydrolase [Akkermansiaceae bacterium]
MTDSKFIVEKRCRPSAKKRLVRIGITVIASVVIIYAALTWWCASEIAQPGRRAIQTSYLPYLNHTANAGFRVDAFTTSDGMPCLVCTPEKTEIFSKRAKIIREQLEARQIDLLPSGAISGTLMILHGRGGIKEDYLAVAERFCAVGFRCVIPDLPGHGSNPKKFTTYGVTEAPMVMKCHQEAALKFNFPIQPCFILGQSMGGSVAMYTATSPESQYQAMVVISSFDQLQPIIRHQTSGLLGSVFGPMLAHTSFAIYEWKTGVDISQIRPAQKAAQLSIPILMVHGESDHTVPTDSGERLYESLPEDIGKKWLEIPQADHNNVLITDYPLYATIAEWLLTQIRPR